MSIPNKKMVRFVDGNLIEYNVLRLVSQYDSILKTPCKEIDFDQMPGSEVAYLAMSLMESLKYHEGLGLSMNQVGIGARMCAINVLDENKIYCLINPKIVAISDQLNEFSEGCLSFPGLFLKIKRPSWVEVEFYAANGQKIQKRFEGIYATCVLHELDHLNGKVFTDLVSRIKLDQAKRKVKQNIKKIKRIKAQGRMEVVETEPKEEKETFKLVTD